jgi:hypothetical protein
MFVLAFDLLLTLAVLALLALYGLTYLEGYILTSVLDKALLAEGLTVIEYEAP